jgi:ABC-2 type transport system ATP-binding protein
MTGLLRFQEGSIELLGNSISSHSKKVKMLFGFVPQDFSFYHELTPVENLEFFGAWAGLPGNEIKKRIPELLEVFGLTEVKNKPVHKFSGGMKRKVNLAIGVLHNPKILFLDEPTVGVDIQTRNNIIAYLKELSSKGTTLIYTSHQLNEAEELCDKIAMIDEGKIIVHDTLDNLLAIHKEDGLEGLFIRLTGKQYKDQ